MNEWWFSSKVYVLLLLCAKTSFLNLDFGQSSALADWGPAALPFCSQKACHHSCPGCQLLCPKGVWDSSAATHWIPWRSYLREETAATAVLSSWVKLWAFRAVFALWVLGELEPCGKPQQCWFLNLIPDVFQRLPPEGSFPDPLHPCVCVSMCDGGYVSAVLRFMFSFKFFNF